MALAVQARDLAGQHLGQNHPVYGATLDNLAGLYQDMADHAAALPLFRQALEIRRTALGEGHPDFAASLINLTGLSAATGRASEALHLMEQAESVANRMIGQLLAIGSDRQRMAYLTAVSRRLDGFLSLVKQ